MSALRPHALAGINVLLLVMLHASYYESSTSRFVFHIMFHVLLHVGLMFHPSNQDVLEECRFKLLIKTYRWNQTHDKETTDIIICVAKNIFVSFAISPCFLSPCLPARFCELSNESNTQVDNRLNTQVDKRIKHLSRHPFHANSWIACIAPHGQNQRVPAKLIDDMYLIAQGKRK